MAAHIRGLGRPHYGPDELQNLLCLCANCHVLFDGLEIYVDSDGLARGTRDGREPRRSAATLDIRWTRRTSAITAICATSMLVSPPSADSAQGRDRAPDRGCRTRGNRVTR
ncbi:HNH endonuclease [Streptomyces sp. NPDC013433]|uniref:HNH endonuclease n=1 Tax=Streptomyces sp. NPDC013433 TaxID=3155604 RepID=UPI0034519DBD